MTKPSAFTLAANLMPLNLYHLFGRIVNYMMCLLSTKCDNDCSSGALEVERQQTKSFIIVIILIFKFGGSAIIFWLFRTV